MEDPLALAAAEVPAPMQVPVPVGELATVPLPWCKGDVNDADDGENEAVPGAIADDIVVGPVAPPRTDVSSAVRVAVAAALMVPGLPKPLALAPVPAVRACWKDNRSGDVGERAPVPVPVE